jgi:DNA-binding response OmpR family regulator
MNPSSSNAASGPAPGKPVIYGVDDEVMILELLTMMLEPLGYQVRTFPDPALAFEAFVASAERPALIITDYAMHTLTGMELIEKCRAIAPEQKILLASGTVGEDIFANSPSKPDRFLVKPFKTDDLVATVRELIGR